MTKENEVLKANQMIDLTINDENYKNARLLVFENYKLLFNEKLIDILHKTYKELKKYNVIKWTTDWKHSENNEINTLIVFVEKVNA